MRRSNYTFKRRAECCPLVSNSLANSADESRSRGAAHPPWMPAPIWGCCSREIPKRWSRRRGSAGAMAPLSSQRQRVLRLLAKAPNGCTESLMLAHGFTSELLDRSAVAGVRRPRGTACVRVYSRIRTLWEKEIGRRTAIEQLVAVAGNTQLPFVVLQGLNCSVIFCRLHLRELSRWRMSNLFSSRCAGLRKRRGSGTVGPPGAPAYQCACAGSQTPLRGHGRSSLARHRQRRGGPLARCPGLGLTPTRRSRGSPNASTLFLRTAMAAR